MKQLRNKSGFTLIEITIVLVVIGLILGGVLKTVSFQRQQLKRDETRQMMENINQALMGFAATNGRLPCPDTDGDGIENLDGGVAPPPAEGTYCLNDEGFVPFVDIGTGGRDAWGSAFRYAVTGTGVGSFTDGVAAGTSASFTMADNGDLRVEDANAGLVANNVPAVIVSYAENGRQTINSMPLCAGGLSATEAENCDTNKIYIYDDYRTDYDDLVSWVSLTLLKSRMLEARLLP